LSSPQMNYFENSRVSYVCMATTECQATSSSHSRLQINSSKTQFLLIGLNKQLAKIHNSSLNTTNSSHNLGYTFDAHVTFSDQISSLSLNPAIIVFVNLAVSALNSIPQQLVQLPPPLFTPNTITVTFFTTTYLSLRLPACNRFRTLLHALLSKLRNPITHFYLTLSSLAQNN